MIVESMMQENPRPVWRQFLFGSLGIALTAIVVSGLFLIEGHSASDIVAIHWNQDRQPDGSGTVSELFWFLSALALAPALVSVTLVALRFPLRDHPTFFWGASALTTFLGVEVICLSWSVANLNRGAIRWQDAAPMPGSHLALLIILPIVLGAGAAFAARQLWPTPSRTTPLAPCLDLEPDERVFWLGRVNASIWLWVGLPLSAIFSRIAAELMGDFSALALLAVLVVLADAFSTLRVTVDLRGLTVCYGHLGLFRQLIPLVKVEGARAVSLQPMEQGGWGYRGSLLLTNKAAVVIRRGEAIELTLNEGRRFLVTVDDAATGAALLNGLVQQMLSQRSGR